METQTLDLTTERCPMALLLAKRAAAGLSLGQSLRIQISDAGARQDIPRYMQGQGFELEVQAENDSLLVVVVTKR